MITSDNAPLGIAVGGKSVQQRQSDDMGRVTTMLESVRLPFLHHAHRGANAAAQAGKLTIAAGAYANRNDLPWFPVRSGQR